MKIRNTIYLYIFIILTKIASDGKIIGENRWGKESWLELEVLNSFKIFLVENV